MHRQVGEARFLQTAMPAVSHDTVGTICGVLQPTKASIFFSLNVPRLRFDPQAFIFGDILVTKGFEVKDHKKVSLQYFFLTVILLLNTAVKKREGFWVPDSPWSVYQGLFLPPPCHCVDHNSKNNFFIPVYIESPSSIAFFALR